MLSLASRTSSTTMARKGHVMRKSRRSFGGFGSIFPDYLMVLPERRRDSTAPMALAYLIRPSEPIHRPIAGRKKPDVHRERAPRGTCVRDDRISMRRSVATGAPHLHVRACASAAIARLRSRLVVVEQRRAEKSRRSRRRRHGVLAPRAADLVVACLRARHRPA